MPRSALKLSRGQQGSVYTPWLRTLDARGSQARSCKWKASPTQGPEPPFPSTAAAWPRYIRCIQPSLHHGGGRESFPRVAAPPRGRDSPSTATPQAICNPPLGTHMLQPCPGKNQQHGGLKHPGQPRLRDGIFCTIPGESCSEELGGAQRGYCILGAAQPRASPKTYRCLNTPKGLGPSSGLDLDAAKCHPRGCRGKGSLALWVQGPRGDHAGTTQGARALCNALPRSVRRPLQRAEGWRRRGRRWRGGKPKCR